VRTTAGGAGCSTNARACRKLTVVINHCGGAVGPLCFEEDPGQRAVWERLVTELAALPNTVMKVGGLQMITNGFLIGREHIDTPVGSDELAELTYGLYSFVIRAFGCNRCMFESNFPVDKWGVGYRTLWNTFKIIARRMGLSDGGPGPPGAVKRPQRFP
jgi:L-fuconolactonase